MVSEVHNAIQDWIVNELPGKILLLPPHPTMYFPKHFEVHKAEKEVYVVGENGGKSRKYDVQLEGRFAGYDHPFGRGNHDEDLAFKHHMEWVKADSERRSQERVRQHKEFCKACRDEYRRRLKEKEITQEEYEISLRYVKNFLENPYWCPEASESFQGGWIDPLISDFADQVPDEQYLPTDKVGFLMVEVSYTSKKDDSFKSQMQDERRFVIEVEATSFYGHGKNLTIEKFCRHICWLWFNGQEVQSEFPELT